MPQRNGSKQPSNKHRTFDLLIIGSGVMGLSIAYHLVNDGFNGRIAVFEKDPTYERASTVISVGVIRNFLSLQSD